VRPLGFEPRTNGLRVPSPARSDRWTQVIRTLVEHVEPIDILLEFVPGDDPAVLGREAETLRSWLPAQGWPSQSPSAEIGPLEFA